MPDKKRFVIIDALAIAYKAYFAFINRPLYSQSGEPTSAVFGFVSQLIKIIEDTKPDNIAVAFDSPEKTFRHKKYELYKSSRAEMPEDMIPQIKRIMEVVEAFEIPALILPGYEADDIVGAAVRQAEKLGFQSIAVTPDKDYIQLVTENVLLAKPGRTGEDIEFIDPNKVRELYGFSPEQMTDFLGLVGDSSDDIPGVAKVGPKTATPLIQEFGSIEGIYENIEKIQKKGLKNNLIAGKESAFLSKDLATIDVDAPIDIDFEKTIFNRPDINKILSLFKELNFQNHAKKVINLFDPSSKLNAPEIIETAPDLKSFSKNTVDYQLITTPEKLSELAELLVQSGLFVFDTETDSLNTFNVHLAGVAFSVKPMQSFFVAINPFIEDENLFSRDLSDRIDVNKFIEIFKPVFENESIKKICQNGKYDIAVLKHYGIDTEGFYFDTMLASYLLDPDQKHGMDELAKTYLNYEPISIKEIIGEKKNAENIYDADLRKLADYSGEDSDITFRLYEKLSGKIEEAGLSKLAYEVEFPLAPVLEEMERTGIKIDKLSLGEFSEDLKRMMDQQTEKIFSLAGEHFNVNSTKQLQTILFEKLGLKPTKKTKTGYSTDARSLELLRGEHNIIDALLNYRQVSKLRSTYAEALPKLIEPSTGKIHTTYNQTVASTGRLSSLNPNLQNIPIRTDMGKEIRKAFVPSDDDHLLLSADYSQIELRIMAHLSKDKGLIEAFNRGEDIHRSTASLVFMVPPEEVTSDMRRKAKEVNFGILYGIGAFGLKSRLGIMQKHAQEIIDTYFNTFGNVKDFMDKSIAEAKSNGFAQTMLGRRRFLKNINSSNRVVRQFEERVAINMPIQGTAADMIKLAMIKIHKELKRRKKSSKMVLQVHDELVFDVQKDELEELKPLIREIMEEALPLSVPIIVDIGIGKNWLEAH